MPPKHYEDARAAFDEGTVMNASKTELEQLLLAVGRTRVLDPVNQARAGEMGETLRQLLAARQSEEMHSDALRVSRVALWVSLAALIASLVQGAVSLNLFAPLKEPIVSFEGAAPTPAKATSAEDRP